MEVNKSVDLPECNEISIVIPCLPDVVAYAEAEQV